MFIVVCCMKVMSCSAGRPLVAASKCKRLRHMLCKTEETLKGDQKASAKEDRVRTVRKWYTVEFEHRFQASQRYSASSSTHLTPVE